MADEVAQVRSTGEGGRNHALNRAWFKMGQHVGAGSISLERVRADLTAAGLATGLPPSEVALVLRDGPSSAVAAGAGAPRDPGPDRFAPDVREVGVEEFGEAPEPELEGGAEKEFWDAREELRLLHDFARARRVSPWAVLGVGLARVVTATPPQVCLPPIVGGKASLNLFVGLVGPSGSGKGAAEAVAADALDVGYISSYNVGSGEGIAHGYKRRIRGELEWVDKRHAVLFSVPEIDSLAAQGDRRGATLMPQLRSGWTGEQLGFGYADPTKRIIVEAHEYRLCLVTGIQPERAGCLINDADAGTPQRFLWLPATDARAPDEAPEEPGVIRWDPPAVGEHVGIGGCRFEVCAEAAETIVQARLARLRGDGDALDGHALLAQLKTAAALALLDRRLDVTPEDWRLAGIVGAKSALTRERIVEALRAKDRARNVAAGEAEAAKAIIVEERTEDAAVQRVCRRLSRQLQRAGEDGATERTLKAGVSSRDRGYIGPALTRLLEAGQIEHDESATNGRNTTGRYRWIAD